MYKIRNKLQVIGFKVDTSKILSQVFGDLKCQNKNILMFCFKTNMRRASGLKVLQFDFVVKTIKAPGITQILT